MGDFCLIPSIQSGYIEECMEGVFDDLKINYRNEFVTRYVEKDKLERMIEIAFD